MLQKLIEKRRNQKGFTIIEVLIVLAIAGLIIAVVLIAIPQLQRNQRNETRRSIVNRVKTELDAYAGNNNGTYPTADANAATGFETGGGFPTRYLNGVNINEPRTGVAFALDGVNANTAAVEGTITYRLNAECNGETIVAVTGGRRYVLYTLLEGGAVYCIDNR